MWEHSGRMTSLEPADKSLALAHLNDICPDTFDEGDFGPWKFTDLTREGDQWTLTFNNGEASGDDVEFTFAGSCRDGGEVDQNWFQQVNAAILVWERKMSGGGEEDE